MRRTITILTATCFIAVMLFACKKKCDCNNPKDKNRSDCNCPETEVPIDTNTVVIPPVDTIPVIPGDTVPVVREPYDTTFHFNKNNMSAIYDWVTIQKLADSPEVRTVTFVADSISWEYKTSISRIITDLRSRAMTLGPKFRGRGPLVGVKMEYGSASKADSTWASNNGYNFVEDPSTKPPEATDTIVLEFGYRNQQFLHSTIPAKDTLAKTGGRVKCLVMRADGDDPWRYIDSYQLLYVKALFDIFALKEVEVIGDGAINGVVFDYTKEGDLDSMWLVRQGFVVNEPGWDDWGMNIPTNGFDERFNSHRTLNLDCQLAEMGFPRDGQKAKITTDAGWVAPMTRGERRKDIAAQDRFTASPLGVASRYVVGRSKRPRLHKQYV